MRRERIVSDALVGMGKQTSHIVEHWRSRRRTRSGVFCSDGSVSSQLPSVTRERLRRFVLDSCRAGPGMCARVTRAPSFFSERRRWCLSRTDCCRAVALRQLVVTEAVGRVIVHETDGLHERIADRRTDEAESAPDKILAQGVGFRRPRRYLTQRLPVVHLRRTADELPDVLVEGAELLLHSQKRARVRDRARHLETIANDARILEQFLHATLGEAG